MHQNRQAAAGSASDNAEEQQRPSESVAGGARRRKRKRKVSESYNYCELLGVDTVPEQVPTNWCKCNTCPTQEISPRDAICCADIRESETELSENWLDFIGEHHEGCFSTHPKIQNLIKNKEELDSFMIIDEIRKEQIREAGGHDPISGYFYRVKQAGYRYACYRKITMLVHGRFGAENYVTTPACVVEAVRRIYPSATNQSIETSNEPNNPAASAQNNEPEVITL